MPKCGPLRCLLLLNSRLRALLNWPDEQETPANSVLPRCGQYESLRLDLHGDPVHANLVVFSDGNHHMALQDSLHAFALAYPAVGNGGEWGQALLDFLFSDAVTKIYAHHGLSRAVP